ncbi:MAG: RNA polymerase sigma factor [Candidatus Gracilibacteria bacterium]|nr:RNA polymerase sigma factor [Candidatus Gracilibacteria bacterium]MDD2908424.1 RNA polymerase sigma factor [Candidatus Gracilibacteria bacterium]
MSEKNLIKKIAENPDAFSYVIDTYREKLMRYIMRTTDISFVDAESLLQDIFIKIYRYINEYDERYSFSSWIYRIAHNMIVDNYRKSKKESGNISLDDEEYKNIVDSLSDGNSPHHDLQKNDIRLCVQKSISSLPKNYKEIILLKYIEGYSYEDISDILKIPIGTSSTLLNRARKQLKENLEKFKCNS